MNTPLQTPFLMLTELFLPTKGGTAVSFDDDFRRLGGKEIHVVTADVPGATEFDRTHPNTIHRIVLKRVSWLKPESLLMYSKLFAKAAALVATHRFVAIFAGRVLPEGLVAWAIARLSGRPVLVYAHGEELTNWGRGRKFALMRFVFRHADAVLSNSDFTRDTLIDLLGVDPGVLPSSIRLWTKTVSGPASTADDLRASIGVAQGQHLILSVGRLQRRKGFDNVIRALPLLQRRRNRRALRIDRHWRRPGLSAATGGGAGCVGPRASAWARELRRSATLVRGQRSVRDAESRHRRRHRGVRAWFTSRRPPQESRHWPASPEVQDLP